MTFGVWVCVHPDDLKRAYDIWWDPTYPSLMVNGHLANALPGWGHLAAPVDLEVVDPDATPYCVRSTSRRCCPPSGTERMCSRASRTDSGMTPERGRPPRGS